MEKAKKAYTRKSVLSALGVLVALLSVFLFLTPFGAFFPVAKGLYFVFGGSLFYVVLPALFAYGIALFVKRGNPLKILPFLRIFLGLVLLAVSLGLFLSYGGIMDGDVMSIETYFGAFDALNGNDFAPYFASLELLGGYPLTLFSLFLSETTGSFLVVLLASIFLLVSLLLFLYPLLLRAFVELGERRKATPKPTPTVERKTERKIELSPRPSLSLGSEETLPTREARYVPEVESSIPKEVVPPPLPDYIPEERVRYPGLREATFVPERKEFALAGVSTSTFVPPPKEEPVPAPRPSAPTPTPASNELNLDTLSSVREMPTSIPETAVVPTVSAPEEEIEEEEIPTSPLPGELPLEGLEEGPVEAYEPPVEEAKPATFEPLPVEEEVGEPEPEPIVPPVTPVAPPPPPPEPLSPFERLGQRKARPRPPYTLPSTDLLKVYPDSGDKESIEAECQRRSDIITQTLHDLGVGAHVVSYTIGPSVTRYDIQCDPGVPVSSVGKYIRDISVRLSGVPTRYEEIVLGKSTSGLEIANSSTTTVSLREMIEHLPVGEKKNLYVPFGKSISGDYLSADLSDFPHMLVAGGTGSGKSIFMHGLIMSLLIRNRPEDLKLVMVDPKRVELNKYKDIPHLLTHVISDAAEAKICLKKLCDEMDRRYDVLVEAGVSNIRQFNSDIAPSEGLEKMPFVVAFIDEYAEIVQSDKEIADYVVRIAQKARAAGIHLVIATQRPSVDVITGVIKANLPVRVALRVSSPTDSMVILGEGGANELNGFGDMLVDCSLVSRSGFVRAQGCMVDNSEIRTVCDFMKRQQGVSYDPTFVDLADHEAERAAMENELAASIDRSAIKAAQGDDFYRSVVEQIVGLEFTSISKIQRQFGIGFPRAGRIFAHLQKDGIVSYESASSSKGCPVLVHTMEEALKLMTSEAKE